MPCTPVGKGLPHDPTQSDFEHFDRMLLAQLGIFHLLLFF